jgi:uncharacterized RDD family membrane protein YckC
MPEVGVPGDPAGWGRRAAAAVIDALVTVAPAVALALLAIAVVPGAPFSEGILGLLATTLAVVLGITLLALVLLATALLYAPLTMRRGGPRNGQTWGKQAMSIRVARPGGAPQTFASAAFREVVVKLLLFGAASLLLLLVPTLLDCLWPLWEREKRALHDMLADSRVVQA